MKFTVEKKALLGAMATAASVVERRNTIPILSNALLQVSSTELTIKATDLDVAGG